MLTIRVTMQKSKGKEISAEVIESASDIDYMPLADKLAFLFVQTVSERNE